MVLMIDQWNALMFDTSFKCKSKQCRCTCLRLHLQPEILLIEFPSQIELNLNFNWINEVYKRARTSSSSCHSRRQWRWKILGERFKQKFLWIKRPRLLAHFNAFFCPPDAKTQKFPNRIFSINCKAAFELFIVRNMFRNMQRVNVGKTP